MTITMHSISSHVFTRMLKNCRSWLDKAQAHAEHKKFDPNVYLGLRLAPDMFPFSRQVQSASDNAKGAVARLAGVDLPKFEDNEQTLDDLRARLDKTLAFIESVPADKLESHVSKEIVLATARGERKWPTGLDYLRHYAMPNFFFHVTTAYAILRHSGVDVGKVDYLNGGNS
jgi:hypothetical protein